MILRMEETVKTDIFPRVDKTAAKRRPQTATQRNGSGLEARSSRMSEDGLCHELKKLVASNMTLATSWSECNYRTWKSPGKSMVCRLSARGFISNCTIQNCNPRNHIAETVISYHVLKDIVWCAAQFFKVSICVRNTISRFRKAYAIYSTIPSKNWLTSTDNALFKF